MKSKVQCPHSISRTCLAQEFGLVISILISKGQIIQVSTRYPVSHYLKVDFHWLNRNIATLKSNLNDNNLSITSRSTTCAHREQSAISLVAIEKISLVSEKDPRNVFGGSPDVPPSSVIGVIYVINTIKVIK